MDLRLSPEQTQLVAAFADLYADSCGVEVVQQATDGHAPELWRRLRETGALEMAVSEAGGGYAATLLDLALVAEQHGRAVAPAPLVEAVVTARLLDRLDGEAASTALAVALAGELTTLALHEARGGHAGLVPAAAVAAAAVVHDGDELRLVPLAGRIRPVANLAEASLADVDLTAAGEPTVVLASGAVATEAFERALDEWRVLTAAALAGVAERALEIGVGYVKERHAFGRPIGSFQAVAHRLADRATEVTGCQLLAREAAWAADEEPDRAAELASMALGFAADTAKDTTYDALHFHGGYGFMLEYPIQLYYRRARGWAGLLESAAVSYRRTGDLHLAAAAAATQAA